MKNDNLPEDKQYAKFIRRINRVDDSGKLDRYPDLDQTEIDRSFPHFRKAADNHRMWHQKKPIGAYQKEVDFPERMFCVGRAYEIIYISDKWEDHADFYSYVHEFDSCPEVYVDESYFSDFELIDKPRNTAKLIGVKSVSSDAKLAAPILARVVEFSFTLNNKDTVHTLRFDFPPLMLCSPDKEGLIILSSQKGPIVVRGGQMEITRRGIVK